MNCRRKWFPCIILLSTIIFNTPSALQASSIDPFAQSAEQFDLTSVINGKKYDYLVPQMEGHQFISQKSFIKGTATINGRLYTDLILNLDVFNQQLVLEYINNQGVKHLLAMSDASVTSFSIGSSDFEFKDVPDGTKQIFQVIGSGKTQVLYGWKKRIEMNQSKGSFYYTPVYKASYVNINDKLIRYKNKRSFLKCFPTDKKMQIKQFIKENRIKFNKATDRDMADLINFCNSIISK